MVGDVNPDRVRGQVEKYWGNWKHGSYRPDIPVEPPASGARTNAVNWPTPTLPWLAVAFRGPAYSDTENDQAALDIISFLGFSESSELYQKLVIERQQVDVLSASNPDRVDPCLFTVFARVKKAEDMDSVRTDILAAFNRFKQAPVPADKLEAVKSHLRYRFLLGLDNSESIAATLAELRRAAAHAGDHQPLVRSVLAGDAAGRAKGLEQVLRGRRTHDRHLERGGCEMKTALVLFAMLLAVDLLAQTKVVALRSQAPLVTFRIVFLTGAASDPASKPGVASLAAAMLSQGGSREMTYKQILDAMFPMATSVSSQVDKEMTVFSATTHVDNLEAFYKIFRAMLLDPGWRPEDFSRLRDDAINYLRVSLRGNNDEELGKEVLYNEIYAGHPYGHHNLGTAGGLQRITLEDLRSFYQIALRAGQSDPGHCRRLPRVFPGADEEGLRQAPREGSQRS